MMQAGEYPPVTRRAPLGRGIRPGALRLAAGALAAILGPLPALTPAQPARICEFRLAAQCIEAGTWNDSLLAVPDSLLGLARDGLPLCDKRRQYTTSPDIVLIMDNTTSMDSVAFWDGFARWCSSPGLAEPEDPACISGDPQRLRGPALETFLDSARVRGGRATRIGIVAFAQSARNESGGLIALNDSTLPELKSRIEMKAFGATNYTAAFDTAMAVLARSEKPRSQQAVIFVSDGRPNRPEADDGGPYGYKEKWDGWPVVHSIFLGDNQDNYRDMQDISRKTGGLFFNIRDVNELAALLTDDISNVIFGKAPPSRTVLENRTTDMVLEAPDSMHFPASDAEAFVPRFPGPLYLAPGTNEVIVRTEYGFGSGEEIIRLSIRRADDGAEAPGPEVVPLCRERAALFALGGDGSRLEPDQPYTQSDSALSAEVRTEADLDSVTVEMHTAGDEEESFPAVSVDTALWRGGLPFRHGDEPGAHDSRVQSRHGDSLFLVYRHPYLPPDSARLGVRIDYVLDVFQAAYWDKDGDGRIESVEIRLEENLSRTPDSLGFLIEDRQGELHRRVAHSEEGEILRSKGDPGDILRVELQDAFPGGITSLANAPTSGLIFAQEDIPTWEAEFPVADSVAPVILEASIPPAGDEEGVGLRVLFSEEVDIADTAEALIVRRDGKDIAAEDLIIHSVESLAAREYLFRFHPQSPMVPVGGDSVAIPPGGGTRDVFDRAPDRALFVRIDGPVPEQMISDFYVTFPNESVDDAVAGAEDPPSGSRVFIPVDAGGEPLPGRDQGRCGNCRAGDGELFAGPVIHVVTRFPLAYELHIFSNHGEFIAETSGRIREGDFSLLEKREEEGPRPAYVQRIVWTGRTAEGALAGTGAYILQGFFRFDRNFATGGLPGLHRKRLIFGHLRGCCP